MNRLVEWLREQLDEDERVAEFFYDTGQWRYELQVGDEYNFGTVVDQRGEVIARCGVLALDDGEERAEHIARYDPARVLAEVRANRSIIDLHAPAPGFGCLECSVCSDGPGGFGDSLWQAFPCETLRLLASVYADRPGYLEEWRP